MAKVANKTKDFERKTKIKSAKKEAAEQLDDWRAEYTDVLKDWNGTKIIRHFRDKR